MLRLWLLSAMVLSACSPSLSPAVSTLVNGRELEFSPQVARNEIDFEPRRSWSPDDLVLDREGAVYVADSSNHRILKILPSGLIEEWAGDGRPGHHDGPAAEAQLNAPRGLSLHRGALWWVDQNSGRIRFMNLLQGEVQSLQTEALEAPIDFVQDNAQRWVADAQRGEILEILSGGALQLVHRLPPDRRLRKLGLTPDGDLYFLDNLGLWLLRRDADWRLESLLRVPQDISVMGDVLVQRAASGGDALEWILSEPYQHRLMRWFNGSLSPLLESQDFEVLSQPRLSYPGALAQSVNAAGERRMVLADVENKRVRVLRPAAENSPPDAVSSGWEITTLARNGTQGFGFRRDGEDLSLPHGLAFDAQNDTLWVSDFFNHRLLAIAAATGQATPEMTRELLDVDLDLPTGLHRGPDGTLYVASSASQRIHKRSADGHVEVLAGSGQQGFVDGSADAAQFLMPFGLDLDKEGNLFVADHGNHSIRKISPQGRVSTVAGTGRPGFRNGAAAQAQFYYPSDVLCLPDGSLLVADSWNHQIRRISPVGRVESWAGAQEPGLKEGALKAARFYAPSALVRSDQGVIYVADTWNHRIRRIQPTGQNNGRVSTLAGRGSLFNFGGASQDGSGLLAQFNQPRALVLGRGVLYVADSFAHRVRVVQLP